MKRGVKLRWIVIGRDLAAKLRRRNLPEAD